MVPRQTFPSQSGERFCRRLAPSLAETPGASSAGPVTGAPATGCHQSAGPEPLGPTAGAAAGGCCCCHLPCPSLQPFSHPPAPPTAPAPRPAPRTRGTQPGQDPPSNAKTRRLLAKRVVIQGTKETLKNNSSVLSRQQRPCCRLLCCHGKEPCKKRESRDIKTSLHPLREV